MRVSLNDIAKYTFQHIYSKKYWDIPYKDRKLIVEMIRDHIKEDLEQKKYINLMIDTLSLMHAEGVNLDFIKIESKE